jgi:D-alanyl-D-alanine carboxypeptidase/D-alanyl-D-alanine-endopeptidase (penicillin-binding protein 4)
MLRFLPLVLLFTTCLRAQSGAGTQVQADWLNRMLPDNPVFAGGHTGFSLYDPNADVFLYGHQDDRYFVPASNVKLLTFFLAQRMLGEGAPALYYREHDHHTEVWPAGYPLLLHPEFREYDGLSAWFASRERPVLLHLSRPGPPRYGAGWSWDDFNYGYVYERSPLPVYGNRLYLDFRPQAADRIATPPRIVRDLIYDPHQRSTIRRAETTNEFTVGPRVYLPARSPVERALAVTNTSTVDWLREAFPRQRFLLNEATTPVPADAERLNLALPDTLYRKLLRDSDNFLAEQLILQCAAQRYGEFAEDDLFRYATDTLFQRLGMGEVSFRDGSGLSRYNLVQPRQFALLLGALHREVGFERLTELLPAGGESGTLRRRFTNRSQAYVWAKTGSLSGVMCISGFLRCRSGRVLAFSFLHNNVMGSIGAYYREMERILGEVHDRM